MLPHYWPRPSAPIPNFWALLSDIHLAGDRRQLGRGINMADHFGHVSRDLLALPANPAGVFINGDCAFNSAESTDYATMAELLDPIRGAGLPVHIALGNHDHRERFWAAFEKEKASARPVTDRQVSLLETPRANWLILDSLETTLATPGLLDPSNWPGWAQTLHKNPKKPALVMIHHNPGISEIWPQGYGRRSLR